VIKATSILVETTEGLIALQHRDNIPTIVCPDKISAWGGKIEGEESPIDGAIREVEEEIGIKISKDNLIELGILNCDKEKYDFDCELYTYLVKGVNKDSLNLMEGKAIYFLDPKTELSHPQLAVHTKEMLEESQKRKLLTRS
jgi:8-oxo-dGTP pyrophosphatase MutT (NUDIX family)